MTTELTTKPLYVFDNAESFEVAQRMANAICMSSFVPPDYQGRDRRSNVLIALEVANRTGASVMMVMQNLHIIHGRPSWSSQFIIGAINSCGRFSPLQYKMSKDKKEKELTYSIWEGKDNRVEKKTKFINMTCIAHAKDKEGNIYESPEISIEMALLEGWYDKKGSKWKTMPELMLRYRAASFFGRLYAPEILMGMYTEEESKDMSSVKDVTPSNSEVITKRFDEPDKAQPEDKSSNKDGYIVKHFNEDGELVPLPDRTRDELQAKAEALIKLVKDGGDKVDLMQAFGGLEFSEKLNTAGLGDLNKIIMEM